MRAIIVEKYSPKNPKVIGLIINLKPIAKKNKYRLARGYMYKDPEVVRYEKAIVTGFAAVADMIELFTGDVSVSAKVYFPKNIGDLDNAIQTIFDALQGLVYKNDKQIKRIDYAEKFVDKKYPRIECTFREYVHGDS